MSEIVQVADAVVAALNTASFSLPIEAERSYVPQFELSEMGELHVTVVPKAVEIAAAARDMAAYDYKIDVAVQKRFQEGDAAELDPLLHLVEEIAEHFRFKRLEGYPTAAWVKTEHPAIYAPEHMESLRQFTSVVTFTFRVVR
jgi:hypothetical protein